MIFCYAVGLILIFNYLLLLGSFSVVQPSESFVIVESGFGLQIQVQFVPLMQVYIRMDNSEENTFEGGFILQEQNFTISCTFKNHFTYPPKKSA